MSAHEHDADTTLLEESEEKKQKTEHGHGHGHGHSHSHDHSEQAAEVVALGTVTLGGATFAIDREGQIEAGKESTFGVELVGDAAAVPSAAWLTNPDGEKLCDPVTSEDHLQHWHFNMTPLMPVKRAKLVLQVGNEEAIIDFAHGAKPCNGGILSVLKAAQAPEWRGFFELKLHGDAGDLELWLYDGFHVNAFLKAKGGKPKPFDVPKETVITLTFTSHAGKTVEMRVRNMDQNEDEAGKPNMRADATNYFIFPGETGADPEWLIGEKARYNVAVAFQVDGKSYGCDPFVLVPHEAL